MKLYFLVVLAIFGIATDVSWGQQATMKAHFIDVGQAASTLLEFPCGAILIDAGAQDEEHEQKLEDFLRGFFERRQDLNNTLAAVFITHQHIDHTRGLLRTAQVCRITNYIDNGILSGSGSFEIKWIRKEVNEGRMSTAIRPVKNGEIIALPQKTGLTDQTIDPLECEGTNPRIRILQGSGWRPNITNGNDQSLVIRIDFGESSFLFTGDLQEDGIEQLLEHYAGTDLLDVDVFQVGHHGSHNATTPALLSAVSPQLAVIGVGRWTYGWADENEGEGYNTHNFGHPRKNVVTALSQAISENRATPKAVTIFKGVRNPTAST